MLSYKTKILPRTANNDLGSPSTIKYKIQKSSKISHCTFQVQDRFRSE